MTHTLKFRSELSLAAFIRELPRKWKFEVEEDPTHAGWYIMKLNLEG